MRSASSVRHGSRHELDAGSRPLASSGSSLRSILNAPPGILFVLLSLALYGNTLGHGYALDDRIVIVDNAFTEQGWRGIPSIFGHDSFSGFFRAQKNLVQGGRYRPLSIATFAIEHQFFGRNPHISHLVNVVLYGLTGWLLCGILRRLLRGPSSAASWIPVPVAATLLFLVHPVHTEVVANIKGRDEILALLLALASLRLQLQFVEERRGHWLVGAGVTFFLGLLAKESALPFLALFPLTLYCFSAANQRDYRWLSLASVTAAIAYAALRQSVMGHALPASPELLNDPFLHATTLQRYATVAYALLRYLGLLVFPHPLTHDYYFDHIPIVDGGHPVAIASVILHAALGWWAWGRLRARDPIAYGVWFYLIALSIVSNLVVSVGVILSERFLYTPSVGFAIAVGHAAHRLERRAWVSGRRWISVATALALGGVMAAFAGATIARNPAWHDDLTLFRTDVRTSANSTKCQTGAGGTLIDAAGRSGDEATRKRFLVEAIVHLRRAVEIYPGHGEAWLLLGNAYAMTESTRAAISCYRQAVASWPGLNQARANLGAALLQEGSYAEAARAYQVLVEREPNNAQAWCGLGQAQEELGNRESAVSSFERAVAVDSTDAKALAKLGTAYGRFRGDLGRARRYLDQAIQKGNREEWVYDNLGVALGSMGRYQEAIRVLDEGLRYHPDSRKLEMSLATTFHLMGDERTSQAHWARAQAAQGKAP